MSHKKHTVDSYFYSLSFNNSILVILKYVHRQDISKMADHKAPCSLYSTETFKKRKLPEPISSDHWKRCRATKKMPNHKKSLFKMVWNVVIFFFYSHLPHSPLVWQQSWSLAVTPNFDFSPSNKKKQSRPYL